MHGKQNESFSVSPEKLISNPFTASSVETDLKYEKWNRRDFRNCIFSLVSAGHLCDLSVLSF